MCLPCLSDMLSRVVVPLPATQIFQSSFFPRLICIDEFQNVEMTTSFDYGRKMVENTNGQHCQSHGLSQHEPAPNACALNTFLSRTLRRTWCSIQCTPQPSCLVLRQVTNQCPMLEVERFNACVEKTDGRRGSCIILRALFEISRSNMGSRSWRDFEANRRERVVILGHDPKAAQHSQ